MSTQSLIYLIAAACGVFTIAAYIGLVLAPAWGSYSTLRERLGAAFLSLYVLAAALLAGVALGGAVAWFWDRIQG